MIYNFGTGKLNPEYAVAKNEPETLAGNQLKQILAQLVQFCKSEFLTGILWGANLVLLINTLIFISKFN